VDHRDPRADVDRAERHLDVGVDEVDVRVSVEAPPEVLAIWDEGARAEEAARAALRHAGALRREAVRTLRADGYTVEAVAAALRISPARVSQLAATPDAGDALAETA
jgi:regulator of protease activity HflC (stomatin/prohibitin superfamily)